MKEKEEKILFSIKQFKKNFHLIIDIKFGDNVLPFYEYKNTAITHTGMIQSDGSNPLIDRFLTEVKKETNPSGG